MHRQILIAWFPWFLSLLAAVVAVWCVLRFSGAKLSVVKLRRLHRCEEGSVQTLSFVLTLPLFILLVMFIVQVAELMVGIAVIHYAAFAAARAAIVWLPAEVPYEPANVIERDAMVPRSGPGDWLTVEGIVLNNYPPDHLWKYRKIWTAAAIACAPMSPSRDLVRSSDSTYISQAIQAMYPSLVPSSSKYPRIRQLIQKKLDYSARNTRIAIFGNDRDCFQGLTYNPWPGHMERDPTTKMDVPIHWNPLEISWQAPITVKVGYNFALLPGPGRFLATVLTPKDGTPDRVSPLIKTSPRDSYKGNQENLRMHVVELTAAVTLSNEGLKSVLPYVQPKD